MTAATDTQVVIEHASVDALDQLRPLWNGMHEHHARIASGVGDSWPPRTNDSSWARRRQTYEQWLTQPDAFLLIACLGDDNIGYLFGRPQSGWTVLDTGERIGEIESLVVRPDHRGTGIGGRLMDAACEEFAALEIDTVGLSVFAENTEAIRFYEARGMMPATVSYLGRIAR